MSRPTLLVSLALAFLALACSSGVTAPDPDPISLPTDRGPADSVTAFVGVRVVPMDREEVLDGHTVLVRSGRIAELAPDGEVSVPDGARIIRGRGRWLMPGLADAHVHMSSTEAPEYVAYGITTVRNMWGFPGVREMGEEIAAGRLAEAFDAVLGDQRPLAHDANAVTHGLDLFEDVTREEYRCPAVALLPDDGPNLAGPVGVQAGGRFVQH